MLQVSDCLLSTEWILELHKGKRMHVLVAHDLHFERPKLLQQF